MKEKRFQLYLEKRRQKNNPINRGEQIQENPDNRIDQDFPGFPHAPSKEEMIKPVTKLEKKTIGLHKSSTNSSGSTITSTSKGKEK